MLSERAIDFPGGCGCLDRNGFEVAIDPTCFTRDRDWYFCFEIEFFGEVLLYFPGLVEQNEEFLAVLGRNWEKYNLCQFVTLSTQMICLLEKLAAAKSPMARRIYEIIA
jgi:hypothetical protein